MSRSQPVQPVSRAQDAAHTFSTVPVAKIERSQFDLTHTWKGTFDAGLLIPVCSQDVIPGDTFNVSTTALIRLLSPLKFPVMDDLYIDFHWWFVPMRLVWSNFVRMMGEQDNPTDSIAYTVPQITFSSGAGTIPTNGSIFDMFGLPTGPMEASPASFSVDSTRLRAYNLIHNQWYRDQNQQNSQTVLTGDTGDVPSMYNLLRRGKRMTDFLVSALPNPQKGQAVTLPLGTTAPVIGDGFSLGVTTLADGVSRFMEADLTAGPVLPGGVFMDSGGQGVNPITAQAGIGLNTNPALTHVFADLSASVAPTINAIRLAFVFQQLLEQFARGGTRYVELIRSLFGVVSPDARLQRAEFLGASGSAIQVFSVPNTTGGAVPQAQLAAYGIATQHGHDFVHSFTEHGWIIGLASVRAPYTYQQRIDRSWSRHTRFDYYMPPMAMLGEQAILSQEVFATGDSTHDVDLVFGFTERWAEYRMHFGHIVGQLRSNFAQTLDFMHLSQILSGSTVLNEDFIVEAPPVDRISAVSGAPDFIADMKFSIRAVRPLPIFSVPGLTRL